MPISDQYDRQVDTYRLAPASGEAEDFQLNLEEIDCEIQPLEESFSQDLQGSFGKDFLMFTDAGHDIKEGDRIKDGDDVYRVTGVEKYAFQGQSRHQELRIRRFHG